MNLNRPRRETDKEGSDFRGRRAWEGWTRILIPPLLAAILAGFASYVAVKVEITVLSTRQETILKAMEKIQLDMAADRLNESVMRDRLSRVEGRIENIEERNHQKDR
jgi:hypothetical protein